MTFAVDKSWAAIFAQRQMGRSSSSLGRPFRRLASGARAQEETEDDPEYGFLSEVNVRIRELNQMLRSANDGISLAQLAGDGLREMESVLTQIQTLLGPSGALQDKRVDLAGIQSRVRGLIDEIDRIVREAQFGDADPPDRVPRKQGDLVGKGETMPVVVARSRAGVVALSALKEGDTGDDMRGIARQLEASVASMSNVRTDMGDVLSKLELAVLSMDTMAENMAAVRVRNEDLPAGNLVTRQVRNTIFQEVEAANQALTGRAARDALTLLS
ncbi:MAG: hypothetical protein HQL66_01845 [Magnetococcales bacterium]|nr:hypothetical protein [Magnetococcales bacterium]